jgi:hypothetical protein
METINGNKGDEEDLESRSVRIAWKVTMIPNLTVLLFGLLLALIPDAVLGEGFQLFAGQSWSALLSASPKTAEYISLFGRMFGAHMIALAVLIIAITLRSFRRGENWSWYTLLISNTLGWGSAIAFELTAGEISIVAIEIVMILLVYIALGISARDILSKKST